MFTWGGAGIGGVGRGVDLGRAWERRRWWGGGMGGRYEVTYINTLVENHARNEGFFSFFLIPSDL